MKLIVNVLSLYPTSLFKALGQAQLTSTGRVQFE